MGRLTGLSAVMMAIAQYKSSLREKLPSNAKISLGEQYSAGSIVLCFAVLLIFILEWCRSKGLLSDYVILECLVGHQDCMLLCMLWMTFSLAVWWYGWSSRSPR